MTLRYLSLLLGIALLACAPRAMAQIELQLQEKPAPSVLINGTPFCPCVSPTVTPAAPAKASQPAKGQEEDIQLGGEEPAPAKARPAAPKASAQGQEEELSIDEEGSAAPAPAAKAAPAKAAAGEEELELDQSRPSPTPVPKAPAPTATPRKAPTKAPTAPTKPAGEKRAQAESKPSSYDTNKWGVLKQILFRATFDGDYSRAFLTDPGNNGFANGFGADFRIEAQLYRAFAMGLYFDPTLFPVPGRIVKAAPLGLFARFILSHSGGTEFYLIAGGGINAMVSSNGATPYPADFNAFGGGGFIQSFGDHWGLDANVVYNYDSPDSEPLRTVSGRVGFTYQINWEDFSRQALATKYTKCTK